MKWLLKTIKISITTWKKKWEIADPKSKLQKNPYNDKFEFVTPYDSQIDPYKSDMD